MAQRLLRRVCQKCAKKRLLTKEEFQNFKKILNNLPPRVKLEKELNEKIQILEPLGCKDCRNGYSGRIAVMELFEINDEMEDLILNSPTEIQIKTIAQKAGFVTMTQDAVIKIINGITTIGEVERVLGSLKQ
jgi:type II secretory ATPase GspE/PulE/Tfp pilus assembly ATPase PilB-like protein